MSHRSVLVLSALGSAGEPPRVKTNPKDGSTLVFIPGGEFTMGSDQFSIERPPHPVRLGPYWIGRTEVTNALYKRFLQESGRKAPPFIDDVRYNQREQPVVGVRWEDAAAYCRWAGARLPTEAEWEFAARGTDGRLYPWGNAAPMPGQAVFGRVLGKGGAAAAVGTTPGDVSPFGVLDLAGNALEWCADWFAPYPEEQAAVEVNPTGPPEGRRHVMRGGCWNYEKEGLRSTARLPTPIGDETPLSGFRIALDAEPAA